MEKMPLGMSRRVPEFGSAKVRHSMPWDAPGTLDPIKKAPMSTSAARMLSPVIPFRRLSHPMGRLNTLKVGLKSDGVNRQNAKERDGHRCRDCYCQFPLVCTRTHDRSLFRCPAYTFLTMLVLNRSRRIQGAVARRTTRNAR